MPSQPEHAPSTTTASVDDSAHLDFLRQGLRLLVQSFIEMEISSVIEAAPYERNQSRRSYRNGYRRRTWLTSIGELTIEIPKLRQGTYYPDFFDQFRQSEPFVLASLHQMYRRGVAMDDVKAIVRKVGFTTVQPAQIADVVEQLYDLVDRFRDKRRVRYADTIISYRPVNAVSNLIVDSRIDDDHLPQSLYTGSSYDWFSESLEVLTRLRQSLSNHEDAVAA